MKVCPFGAELFHAGGRTVMRRPMAVFRDFANTPKNGMIYEGLGTRLCLHTYTHTHTHTHTNMSTFIIKKTLKETYYRILCIYVCEHKGKPLLETTGRFRLTDWNTKGSTPLVRST